MNDLDLISIDAAILLPLIAAPLVWRIRSADRARTWSLAIAAFTPRGRLAGKLMLEDGPKFLAVQYIHVEDEFQRCGVGTRLYEKALAIACDYGKRLASDDSRTRFSEGFWAKQVKKGRAQCVSKSRGIKLDDEWRESGEYWSCGRYAVRAGCAWR